MSSSLRLQEQLDAALQHIQTLEAENLLLQGISFRLETHLEQSKIKSQHQGSAPAGPTAAASLLDSVSSAAKLLPQAATTSTKPKIHTTSRPSIELFSSHGSIDCLAAVDCSSLLPETHNITVEPAAAVVEQKISTWSASKPSLELISSHSSESVSFVPVADYTPINTAPAELKASLQAEPAAAPPAATSAAAIEAATSPTQPSTPAAAVVSPFAAYSHRAFTANDDNWLQMSRPRKPLQGLLSLSSSSSSSSCGQCHLLGSMALTDDGQRPGGGFSRDGDDYCHQASSSVSSLVCASSRCESVVVCVVQHTAHTNFQKYADPAKLSAVAKKQKRGWLNKVQQAFKGCFRGM